MSNKNLTSAQEQTRRRPAGIRRQVFIPQDVIEALDRYFDERYGHGRRPVSATISRALVMLLRHEGYWSKGE